MFSELFAYLRIFFGNKAGKDIHANTFYLSDTTLRDTLLPKLMSGELNVFDKPNDQS